MCVVGLPVARYVYSFGTGEASGHWHNWLAHRPDKSEVSGSIPECPTTTECLAIAVVKYSMNVVLRRDCIGE